MGCSSVAGADGQSTFGRHSESVEKSSFCRRAVSVACNVITFLVGAVFFPLVSIGFAFDVYLDGRYDPKKSVNERALEVLQAFLIPIPIIGAIVLLSSGQCKRMNKEDNLLGFAALCLPCVGSGFLLLNRIN